MLRLHIFSIFIIKTPRTLNREETDTCTLTLTCFLLSKITLITRFMFNYDACCIRGTQTVLDVANNSAFSVRQIKNKHRRISMCFRTLERVQICVIILLNQDKPDIHNVLHEHMFHKTMPAYRLFLFHTCCLSLVKLTTWGFVYLYLFLFHIRCFNVCDLWAYV